MFDKHTSKLYDALKGSQESLQRLQFCAAGFPPPVKLRNLLVEDEARKVAERLADRSARTADRKKGQEHN